MATEAEAAAQQVLERTPPEPIMDGSPQEPTESRNQDRGVIEPEGQEYQRPTPRIDTARNEIVARFRDRRANGQDQDDDAAEIRRFANQGLPPDMVPERQQDDPEPPEPAQAPRAAPEPEPPPAPRKLKLKIMGEERELTEEEVIAAAQKTLAGDHYFEESKAKLRETEEGLRRVNALLHEHENSGRRPAQVAPHQDDQNGTQTDGTDVADQDSQFTKLTKDIVYGDPEEAGRNLQTTVEATAEAAAQRATRATIDGQRQDDEISRNRRFIAGFKEQHTDIDEVAESMIGKSMMDLQREDLVSLAPTLGIKPEQIPSDPKAVAQWHLFYRAGGKMPVRSIEEIATQAYNGFVEWETKRGRRPADPPADTTAPERAPPQAAKGPVVTVDRQERRMSIQQQPTRTSVPRETGNTAPAPKSRSQVVQNMIVMRGKPRGRIGLTQ